MGIRKKGKNVVQDNNQENVQGNGQGNVLDNVQDADMDIDRMVNEGLGGGNVTLHNGLIEATPLDGDNDVVEAERE